MKTFHQRHENLLHLLIAQVLFVRLFWSKVQDIPEHSLLYTYVFYVLVYFRYITCIYTNTQVISRFALAQVE